MSTPSISPDGQTIYFGSFVGKLHAMNRDGTEKWSTNVGGIIDASPTVSADGMIYARVQPESIDAKYDPAKNPYIGTVPCHRVVRSDGSLGGFSRGRKKKINMLKKENGLQYIKRI